MSSSTTFPRLPLHDGFFIDARPRGERKVINPTWQPKNGGPPLRIEIGNSNDVDLAANFINNHFIQNNDLRKIMSATYEEMKEYSFNNAKKALEKPVSWLVFDGDKLVAAILRTYYTPEEYLQLFNGDDLHHSKNPKFVIKDDYAEDINNGPYNSRANRVVAMNKELISQLGKFLPKDCKNLVYGFAIGVHPKYMRNGLAEYLIVEGIKHLKTSFDCNYSVSICSSLASYKAFIKLGYKDLYSMQYKDYKAKGKIVFEHVPNILNSSHVMLLDLNQFV